MDNSFDIPKMLVKFQFDQIWSNFSTNFFQSYSLTMENGYFVKESFVKNSVFDRYEINQEAAYMSW